jgi:HAMP domain-containing protein
VKGNSHHRVSKGGGKVGADMGRGGGRGGKEVIVGFLEAVVDVAAEVGKLEDAVGKIRERWRGGGLGKGD